MEKSFSATKIKINFRFGKLVQSRHPAIILLGLFVTIVLLSFACSSTCIGGVFQSNMSHSATCGLLVHSFAQIAMGLIAAAILPLFGFLRNQHGFAILPEFFLCLFKPPRLAG